MTTFEFLASSSTFLQIPVTTPEIYFPGQKIKLQQTQKRKEAVFTFLWRTVRNTPPAHSCCRGVLPTQHLKPQPNTQKTPNSTEYSSWL